MADPIHKDMAATGQATLANVRSNDRYQGAAVHTFDPDASPEEKARIAGRARQDLKGNKEEEGAASREVKVAASTTNAPPPTITVQDMDKLAEETAKAAPDPGDLNGRVMPGTLPTGAAPAIPDWYRVGWRAVGAIDAPPPGDDERDTNAIALFLSDMYYGQFYHNAGVIFFAVATSHYLTVFRLGWGWLMILLAFCATYYSASIARVRRRARDDIQRELIKNHLATEHESADWINNFLDRFWLIYEPVLSATIVTSVDQILSTSTPAFLDSIRLSTFTLGTKAPRIDKVRTFPRTSDDVVLMDWGFSFTPNDISDLTPAQQVGKVNPKIVLNIKVGKGIATAAMPILLEDISFKGLLRIKLKLVSNFPHVQIVEISFLEKPIFDYVLKPIGGETFGFDIGNIPGLSAFIRDMVHATLGPMMYDPNVFTLNLEQLLSGTPLDAAVGVLQIHLVSARQLKGAKIGGGTPDPYVAISINNRETLAQSKFKASTYNPHFGSNHFLLLTSTNLSETLNLTILDHNEHRKDSSLGSTSFQLQKLLEDATQENIKMPVLKDGKDRGELLFDLTYYPVLTPTLVDGKPQPLPETSAGILRLIVHQAKELDAGKSMSGDLNPFAKVSIGSVVKASPRFKHTISPVWEFPAEFLVPDKANSIVTLKVVDDRDFLKDPMIGYMSIKLTDLLAAKDNQRDWFPLSGCKSGRVRISAEWKPLEMAGGVHGANHYLPPIGVVRIWMKKAEDLKNVEAALGGKSDPYVRFMLNNTIEARTEVINNNLNPEWDQIVYVPVHSLRESLFLECMDYQHLTKDRSLGSVEVKIGQLATQDVDPRYPFKSLGKLDYAERIRLDRNDTYKGKLYFAAEFIPSLNLKGVAFESDGNEIEKAVRDDSDVASGDKDSVSSSEEEEERIPQGPTVTDVFSSPVNGSAGKTSHQLSASTDTADTAKTLATETAADNNATQKSDTAVALSQEDLFKHQSGIIVFNVASGQLSKKARLEIMLEDGSWPAFTTGKPRSTTAKWDEVGEGFIKELDFGRVWLRLNESDEGEKDQIIGEYKLDAKAFLDQSLTGPATFTLKDADNEVKGTVEITSRYIPVNVQLEPRESINNMGLLSVTLVDGREIHGADRSGKSDPFVVFSLNGEKVFKSQTKKKTLVPVWNETFEVPVPSRVGADCTMEVFDWNQVEQAKSLGMASIELGDLDPFQATPRIVSLSHAKHGEKGEVRITLLFRPEVISRSRKKTSTFSTAGRAMTQIGGAPLGAGKGIAHGVGNVGHKALGVFKRDKGGDDEEDVAPIPQPPSTQISQPVSSANGSGNGNALPSSSTAISAGTAVTPPEFGTLRVTVVGAKDLSGAQVGESVKPYVVLRCGDKEQKTKHTSKTVTPEWDEQFIFTVGPETKSLVAGIYDHKTLGKDRLLGETDVDIWRHLQPTGPSPLNNVDVWAELREGLGLLHLRLDFNQNPMRSGTMSVASLHSKSPSASPSRFSLGRRHNGSDE